MNASTEHDNRANPRGSGWASAAIWVDPVMILVRPFCEDDKPVIQTMHSSMGFDYEQPDWEKMLVSAVAEVDGIPTMAIFLRKTAESYMLFNPAMGRKRDQLG